MLNSPDRDEAPNPGLTKILPEDGSPEVISEDPAAQAFTSPEPEVPPEQEPQWPGESELLSPPSPEPLEEPLKPDRDLELLQTFEAKLGAIQADLSRMCLRIDNKIMVDEIRDRTITDLSSELKVLRENQLFRAMKPLINGIIDVADDMTEIIKTLKEGDEASRLLKYFHTMLHDVLATVDVSPYISENQPYEAARHSIVTTQATPDPALDKLAARSILTGYLFNDTVMRKEKIAVYKHEAPAEEPSPGTPEPQSDQII